MIDLIRPASVRYIKLGRSGIWENECINQGIIRFGYDAASPERFPLCQQGRWDELSHSFIKKGRSKGTATRFTKEARLFFEDEGDTLWITFAGDKFFWGMLDPSAPEQHVSGDGVWRKVIGGWKNENIKGDSLTKGKLSGALTKLANYRGTSCNVDVAEYVVQRINGVTMFGVEEA